MQQPLYSIFCITLNLYSTFLVFSALFCALSDSVQTVTNQDLHPGYTCDLYTATALLFVFIFTVHFYTFLSILIMYFSLFFFIFLDLCTIKKKIFYVGFISICVSQ